MRQYLSRFFQSDIWIIFETLIFRGNSFTVLIACREAPWITEYLGGSRTCESLRIDHDSIVIHQGWLGVVWYEAGLFLLGFTPLKATGTGRIMKRGDLQNMSTEELWDLHEKIVAELSSKMASERDMLEARLRQLKTASSDLKGEKRPYPKVLPKYRNPKNREETWAGRGKQPRWLSAQLRSGRKLADFLIR